MLERADPDVILALALVHHIAISRNVPLPMLLELFAELAPWAIVEFVPKEDPMVRRLLATRRDVFPGYTLDGFRAAAAERWEIAVEEARSRTAHERCSCCDDARKARPSARLGSRLGDVREARTGAASWCDVKIRSGSGS